MNDLQENILIRMKEMKNSVQKFEERKTSRKVEAENINFFFNGLFFCKNWGNDGRLMA